MDGSNFIRFVEKFTRTTMKVSVIMFSLTTKKFQSIYVDFAANYLIKIKFLFLLQLKPLAIFMIAITSHFAMAQIDEATMKNILGDYSQQASVLCNRNSKASWAVQTDVLNSSLLVEMVRKWGSSIV